VDGLPGGPVGGPVGPAGGPLGAPPGGPLGALPGGPVGQGPARPGLPVLACAGVPITSCRSATAARLVLDRASAPLVSGSDVHLCNAYTLALADRDQNLHALLRRAALNFPDGRSVVWANRVLHRSRRPPAERVYGPDLLRAVFLLGQAAGLRHYLLASTEPVLTALHDRLRRDFPDAQIVGAESSPSHAHTESDRRAQRDRIRRSRAQLVWVGLGTPRQDREAARLAAELPVVAVAVGTAFDLVAGGKRQAPLWMQRYGLDWCLRLAHEPHRLWRQYLLGNIRFLYAVCRRLRRPSGTRRPTGDGWPTGGCRVTGDGRRSRAGGEGRWSWLTGDGRWGWLTGSVRRSRPNGDGRPNGDCRVTGDGRRSRASGEGRPSGDRRHG
jgi:N-acetylglucosaminyldiphosphoundecaprenol N-acetyl-beta-D-mannosaminyltransferase